MDFAINSDMYFNTVFVKNQEFFSNASLYIKNIFTRAANIGVCAKYELYYQHFSVIMFYNCNTVIHIYNLLTASFAICAKIRPYRLCRT